MQTHVTFRNLDSSDALRQQAESSLGKLGRVYTRIESAHVTLIGEGLERKAEIRLVVPGPDLFCSEQRPSAEAAIEACVESLRRLLVKHKEKHNTHVPDRTVWH